MRSENKSGRLWEQIQPDLSSCGEAIYSDDDIYSQRKGLDVKTLKDHLR